MKLGIDFGTTRIVVAAADRGNYPVLPFDDAEGQPREWIPALAAVRGPEMRFGWAAAAVASDPSWTLLRSLKRLLESAGPATRVAVGSTEYLLLDLLTGLAMAIRGGLRPDSHQVVLGVPANANSNQRFLTGEAFRRAGFAVLGLLNEPSAAGLEYAHASRRVDGAVATPECESLLIYDLGGGTFDVSRVLLRPGEQEVVATESISTLGGDDFDEVIAEMALPNGQLDRLGPGAHFRLLEQCRELKESLTPNSRRLLVETDHGPVTIPVADYYDRCRPLIDETLHAVDDLLLDANGAPPDVLYVTGGASELPLVSRMLRERFGRRVKRSAYTRAATAIGLAIQADGAGGFTLRERFSRYFGVWREADCGTRIIFDPIFAKGTILPRPGEPALVSQRTYSPAHNIGHFRYLEATALGSHSEPAGNLTLWDEILFPFDPALRGVEKLSPAAVCHSSVAQQQEIVEAWSCDENGVVEVSIENRTAGYSRRYRLGRWNHDAAPAKPVRSTRRKVKA
jgi:molecular chaperone DnaK (HSP70)